jgi:GNAT superfamily N-acetyltransferase
VEIIIKTVAGGADESAMRSIRHEVFEREMGIRLDHAAAPDDGSMAHLLARAYPGREAVGTLSVVDTSGDERLHAGHNLCFEPGARAARFMHLAVVKAFRGRNIPAMMMLEAHRRFVAPRRYDYTWLLFNAERAPTSFLARLLGFSPKADIFTSEYGRRCPLVRDERAAEAAEAIRRAEQLLRQSGALYALAPPNGAGHALSA